MTPSPQRRRRAVLGYTAFAVLCFLGLVWPVYPWAAARAPLLVLGVPFALAWNTGWVVASFVALCFFERAFQGPGGG